MTEKECSICIEKFNKTNHFCVECNYCNYPCCRACYEKYFLSQTSPKCINCLKDFTREFMHSKFTKTFLNTTYKKHREKCLLDIEKSMLPATQPVVEQMKERDNIRKRIAHLRNEIDKFYSEINSLENLLHSKKDPIKRKAFIRKCPNTNCRGFLSTQWKCHLCEKKTCKECNECMDNENEHKCDPNNVETTKLLNQDSKACPTCGEIIFKIDGCFGENVQVCLWNGETKLAKDVREGDILLGDDFKKRKVLHCFRGVDKLYKITQEFGDTYVVNSRHPLCMMDTLRRQIVIINAEQILALQKNRFMGVNARTSSLRKISIEYDTIGYYYGWETNKNKLFLLKDGTIVHNCDQIFCTNCHTAFNWKTGIVENGVIHNPHYFEWLKQTDQNISRENEIRCGREIDNNFTTSMIRENRFRFSKRYDSQAIDLCRSIIHFRQVELPRYMTNRFEDNQDLRIRYLMNDLSEDDFQVIIQKREKQNEKRRDYHRLFSMMVQCLTEIIYRYRDKVLQNSEENIEFGVYYEEIINLLSYINECLRNISKIYTSKLYTINIDLQIK